MYLAVIDTELYYTRNYSPNTAQNSYMWTHDATTQFSHHHYLVIILWFCSILTSNIYTYTGDQRFSIIHPPDSDDYDLKIEYAQERDSGIYECQVNTEPKINLAVYLHVTGNCVYMPIRITISILTRFPCVQINLYLYCQSISLHFTTPHPFQQLKHTYNHTKYNISRSNWYWHENQYNIAPLTEHPLIF